MEQIEWSSKAPSQPGDWLNSNAVTVWIITQTAALLAIATFFFTHVLSGGSNRRWKMPQVNGEK
jgi:hypothetical protein